MPGGLIINRHRVIACGLIALFVWIRPGASANAGPVLPAAARAIDGGRDIVVVVPQHQLYVDAGNPGIELPFMGGPLWQEALKSAINAKTQTAHERAEDSIGLLRDQLKDLDVATLATDATRKAISTVGWLGGQEVTFGSDGSGGATQPAADHRASQVMTVNYAYDLSSDLTGLIVTAKIQITSDPSPALSGGSSKRKRIFDQTVYSVVTLDSASKSPAENIRRWTAENGRLAREAMKRGFAEMAVLIPQALNLTEADLDVMTARDKKVKKISDFEGWVQDVSPSGTLILLDFGPNFGLAHLETLSP